MDFIIEIFHHKTPVPGRSEIEIFVLQKEEHDNDYHTITTIDSEKITLMELLYQIRDTYNERFVLENIIMNLRYQSIK